MNNKLIISALIIAAIGIGYFFGIKNNSSINSQPNKATISSPSHNEKENNDAESKIPGAHHIHALTYDYEGNLLLGSHGGLFKSKDDGKTWKKVKTQGSVNSDDFMSLATDPINRRIMFAGGHDLGVIKSIDGGTTWMRADEGINGTDIHALAINQREPSLLFAYSVDNGVFKSKDGGASWKRDG